MFEKEKIYIAGPECFYRNGYTQLDVMKRRAEEKGFGVTLPNNHPLDLDNPDLRKRADSIFEDLKTIMKETTVIIADLEAYRGSEPDSGTVYEIGMAYADGLKCYGYTRDKRPLACKDQKYVMRGSDVFDEHGNLAPYRDLPFAPTVVGATKIVEGDFDDCLRVLMNDIEEEWKGRGRTEGFADRAAEAGRPADRAAEAGKSADGAAEAGKSAGDEPDSGKSRQPIVYLADVVRYGADAPEVYRKMKEIAARYGLVAVAPSDGLDEAGWTVNGPWGGDMGPLYARAAALTRHSADLIRGCDAVIADLNDYRGYECSNDVGFECGMAFEWGKKLYGYMDDTRPCIERLPHLGEQNEFRDMTGSNVENFGYPINLMFACSMKIFEGKFEEIVKAVAEDLKGR